MYRLERHGHLFMLKDFIEGPEGKAFPKLLLDTGSAYTIISQEILENIGCSPAITRKRQRIITGSGYEIVPIVCLNRLHCLGKSIENFEVLAHTLPFGTYGDGLLGMDFMDRFEMEIKIFTGEILIQTLGMIRSADGNREGFFIEGLGDIRYGCMLIKQDGIREER